MIAMVHLIDSRDKRRLTINPCSIALSAYHPAIPKWLDPKTVRSKEIISKTVENGIKSWNVWETLQFEKEEKRKTSHCNHSNARLLSFLDGKVHRKLPNHRAYIETELTQWLQISHISVYLFLSQFLDWGVGGTDPSDCGPPPGPWPPSVGRSLGTPHPRDTRRTATHCSTFLLWK